MDPVYGRLRLDKEDNGGRWLLSCRLDDGVTEVRLRVSVGGPWDWHCFRAEVQCGEQGPCVLGEFDVAPIEIIPRQDFEDVEPDLASVEQWNPDDEPEFQQLPLQFRTTFATMVREWGRLIGVAIPASAWLTIH